MNGIIQKHWLGVFIGFITDALLLLLAMVLAAEFRLGAAWVIYFPDYLPSIVLGAVVLGCACYTFGLYAIPSAKHGLFIRSVLLAASLAIAVGFMLAAFYLNFSGRIGRGVLLPAIAQGFGFIVLHHAFLVHRARTYRERVALLVTSREDEEEWRVLEALGNENLELVGMIRVDEYEPDGSVKTLGGIDDIDHLVAHHRLARILCTNAGIANAALYRRFSQLRYSGVPVMPLVSICEEIYHCVPVSLITPEWLLSASGSPHVFYIRKLKRGFDIVASLFGLVAFSLPLLVGMIILKLGSKGPVFYRQRRSGRFGRAFEVIKLRTMRLDAEKDGAKWASVDDSRVIFGGGFLRKFRIDEIPQLINVLRGEMSFVGPRPERPEFVGKLAAEIPYYEERMMVQPGITGWAQVSYPYGASVEDARRKLEYDLYYMKNMSLFLDVFILLDTVRIILRGGMTEDQLPQVPVFRTNSPVELAPGNFDAGGVGRLPLEASKLR